MDRRRLGLAIGAGAYLLLVMVPLLAVAVALGGGGAAAASCEGPGGALDQTDDGGAGGGDAGAAGGAQLTGGDQLAYAQLITSIVVGRGLPQQAAVVAIATAAQESRLGQAGMNTAVDHDSLGLFQQRPSAGWGSPGQVKDPTYATNKFLDTLAGIGGWAAMPVTRAAQTVQRSAIPGAYARWEPLARELATRFWPANAPTGGDPAAAAAGAGAPATAAGVQTCPGEGGDGLDTARATPGDVPGQPPATARTPGAITVPPDYQPPADPQVNTAVSTALDQLGKPYQWGAAGPAAFDCSGLMVASWSAAGVTLPRTAAAQSHFGAPVPDISQLQPGDLVFIPGAHGTAAAPGHVGMAIGGGRLVDAPQTGRPIEIIPVTNWSGRITAIRRPGVDHPDPPVPTALA